MADDMMNAEAIETLAVQLVGDASPLLESVDAAVEQAKAKLASIGEPVPEVQSAIQSLVAALEEEWKALGITVSPEVLARIQDIAVARAEEASNLTDVNKQMELYQDTIREIQGVLGQGIAAGQVTAIPGAAGTQQAEAVAGAQDRAARSTRNWFNQAFSLEGMVKKLGLRLLATLGPVALFYKGFQYVTRTLREAEKAAVAYDTAMFRLEVSVRAAQRVMGDSAGTIEEWRDAARTIAEKYGLYTETAMIEVAASVRRLTLQFGLAADQAIALTDAGVAVATVFGDSPGSVTQALAMFVSTGQNAEGLRQFGFDVGTVGLQAEATRMGLHGLYRELSDGEQIQVRANAVMEQSAVFMEDATVAAQTLAGEQAANAAAVNEQMVALGQSWEPIARLARGIATTVKLFFASILGTLGQLISIAVVGWMEIIGAVAGAITAEWESVTSGEGFLSGRELARVFVESGNVAGAAAERWIAETVSRFGRLGDVEDAAAQSTERMAERMRAAFDDLRGVFGELASRIKNTLKDIDEAYQADLLELNEDTLRERQKKTEDYAREEERDLQDHLLKMRRMEEDYLLELEDAVRARDARQVLLLMRRHRIDVRRADEDVQIRRRQRREDFQAELQDMEEQANLRRRELQLEWQDRRQRALEEHEAYAKQLIEQWIRENGITAEGLQQLHDMLLAAFGPGGWEVALFDQAARIVVKAGEQMANAMKNMVEGMAKSVQAAVSVVQKTLAWMASERVGMGQQRSSVSAGQMGSAIGAGIAGFWGGGAGTGGNPYTGGYQGGGDFVATGPRTIRVGEGRPEAVSIRPFSGSGAAAGGQGGGGRAKMEIDLNVKADPRLIVEATEAAMSEVADVFINITRVSREGRG